MKYKQNEQGFSETGLCYMLTQGDKRISEPKLMFPVYRPETTVSSVEASFQLDEQQVLQGVPGHPQPFHQAILAVTHGQAKAHICHIVSGEQQLGQAQQGGPAHHQDPHGGCVHQLGKKEAGTHGCPRSVARGEGAALHKEGGEDVRAVLSRPSASHQSPHSSDQHQVQDQSFEEERGIRNIHVSFFL